MVNHLTKVVAKGCGSRGLVEGFGQGLWLRGVGEGCCAALGTGPGKVLQAGCVWNPGWGGERPLKSHTGALVQAPPPPPACPHTHHAEPMGYGGHSASHSHPNLPRPACSLPAHPTAQSVGCPGSDAGACSGCPAPPRPACPHCPPNLPNPPVLRAQNVDYVGLDASQQHLLFYASSPETLRDLRVPLSVVKRLGSVSISSDLANSHLYVLNRCGARGRGGCVLVDAEFPRVLMLVLAHVY